MLPHEPPPIRGHFFPFHEASLLLASLGPRFNFEEELHGPDSNLSKGESLRADIPTSGGNDALQNL